MNKQKTNFKCTNCDYATVKWIGQCPTCNEWNSFVEQNISTSLFKGSQKTTNSNVQFFKLNEIETTTQQRMLSGIKEWDQVVGNGILPGSFSILTGDPGIGKSTLLLQVADKIADTKNVIYFSTEESLQQLKNRATRLNLNETNLLFCDESNLENILSICQNPKPDLIIIDSIQSCYLSNQSTVIPGTIGQLREASFHLLRFAKENNVAIFITGHITKDGQIAGPKLLEHMVDGVFYLQGEDRWHTRILRSVKNRFGAINEIGFFEMQEDGLVEINDINQQLLNESSSAPGSSLICCLEGRRPILLELQALCVTSKFGIPQRVVTGIDPKRIILIAAILEKYLHIKFSSQDIFFKVSTGVKIKESSIDIGIALALLSSYFQKTLPTKILTLGEISLTGQVKPTNQAQIRINEAEKFGINSFLISANQQIKTQCQTIRLKNIYELLKLFPE
ncbi:MAG: DNA repair protein RadA [bacterium]